MKGSSLQSHSNCNYRNRSFFFFFIVKQRHLEHHNKGVIDGVVKFEKLKEVHLELKSDNVGMT